VPGKYRAQISVGSGGSREGRSFEVLDGGNPPSGDTMREIRRRHAAAVTVVTTMSDDGFRGITVSAFCLVSLAPPIVLICLDRNSEALAAIKAAGQFAVSILSDTQEFLAERFAGRAPLVNSRFEGVKHRLTRAGNPVLEDCLAWLDCTVQTTHDGGDHVVVLGSVREGGYGSGVSPLLYFDGAYRELQVE
jgi:flavin reductase (DIM6/NTAB) family NADH-FMN oxidoreductase RutF